MGKSLYIAEKPSVAQQFADALKISARRSDGYIESDTAVVTWCVGHLVTMSYPEAYDPALRRWSLQTLPFLPKEFKYQVIDGVSKQFAIVSRLLNRLDVDTIYICTDSGREGEYIYRLVDQMAGVKGKTRKRVWIDSQTEEEILRGIRDAKDWSEYDNLAASAHLKIWPDDFCFFEGGPHGAFRGPGHDLRARYGGAPGEGNPQFREDAILPGDRHVFIPGYEV